MHATIDLRSAQTARWAGIGLPSAPVDFQDSEAPGGLQVRLLRTALEREAISRLRRHAAFGVENDLGCGLQAFEQTRDEIGMVTAVYRDERLLATMRLVPTGHGLTGAERLHDKVSFDSSILAEGSWEVGRMIMEPEDRHPELLQQCVAAILEEVMQRPDVRQFHATTTLPMARLWRRVGMRTLFTTAGASGTKYALVHGTVEDVAAALHVPHYVEERGALLASAIGAPQHRAVHATAFA